MSAIEDYIRLLPDAVSRELKIVTPETLGQDFFLHLSINQDKKPYTPFVSRRGANQEDNSTPRVTVSDSLFGCLNGYAGLVDEIFMDPQYKRGVYINLLPFEFAVKPSKKLVYDQEQSNEHWLLPFNEDNKVYKFDRIGKLFIVNMNTVPDDSQRKYSTYFDIYIELSTDKTIKFSKEIFLKKGYYSIKNIPNCTNEKISHKKQYDIFCEEITKKQYDERKVISAATLSYKEKPLITKW